MPQPCGVVWYPDGGGMFGISCADVSGPGSGPPSNGDTLIYTVFQK
jgi:hypothetical protein